MCCWIKLLHYVLNNIYIYYLNLHYVLIYVKDVHLIEKITKASTPDSHMAYVYSGKLNPKYFNIGSFCIDHIAPRVYVVHNIQGPL